MSQSSAHTNKRKTGLAMLAFKRFISKYNASNRVYMKQ